MAKRIMTPLSGTVLLLAVGWGGLADDRVYVPGIKIVLEVRTPQGDLRSFHRPGLPPTYWAQEFPVVKGDRVTISPFVATGGAELEETRIRLDHKVLSSQVAEPWRVEVDTANLDAGHHFIEVWASTKAPHSRWKSVTTSFLVVPRDDPLLRMLEAGLSQPEAPMPGPGAVGRTPVSDEERLACAIGSLDPKVSEELSKTSSSTVTGPTLFFVSAGPGVKEFFYTLTRDGVVTYTSPRLPLLTHILLEPLKSEVEAPAPGEEEAGEIPGPGLEPGEVILTVRAGDGAGRFGPPAWVTVRIEPAGEEAGGEETG